MANATVPHFHNTEGLRQIEVGAKEFMCVGALPPFDLDGCDGSQLCGR